jgi:uncharacterized protein YsxB (DUF464 family)
MIRVTVVRERQSGRIAGFTLVGHAQYAEPGKDIVCAGVSAVAFGTVNSVEALLGVTLDCTTDEREGRLEAQVPKLADAAREERLQLLLESMVVMLNDIGRSYGKYMKITTKFR